MKGSGLLTAHLNALLNHRTLVPLRMTLHALLQPQWADGRASHVGLLYTMLVKMPPLPVQGPSLLRSRRWTPR